MMMHWFFSIPTFRIAQPVFAGLAAVATAVALTGCGPSGAQEDSAGRDTKHQIVATVGMIADIVRQVAGERAEVLNIVGEGVDPHLYKPTSLDVKALYSADVIFYNGLLLEGKMADLLARMAGEGKPVHAIAVAIVKQGDFVMKTERERDDPHVWMDVGGWIRAVQAVADALAAFDPGSADSYRANAAAYTEQLEELDGYARRVLASIPESSRVLVTAHDAFHYLARAYGMEVRGIQGISTESEAGVKDIEALVNLLVERKIPAVFVETSVSDKNVRALVEGARARGHEVRVGGKLFSDAMGPAGTYEGTYIGMIDHNVTTIARALGGDAPEAGLYGRLGVAGGEAVRS